MAAPGLAYEVAALGALRRRQEALEQEALEKLSELTHAPPEARLDEMLYGTHKARANADMVLDYLKTLGWVSPSKRAVNE